LSVQAGGPAGAGRPLPLATIGYEHATVADLLDALGSQRIDLLVDVRAVANSRRPGFARTRLRENLATREIEYLHLRGLGTPADGRAAARAGDHGALRRIFSEHLESEQARAALDRLQALVLQGRRACLLCLEADPEHCHRSMVAEALALRLPLEITHLRPGAAHDG
jgi:uncharacterized protein (DUF488 family)